MNRDRAIMPILFGILFLVMMGFGMIIPIMPYYAKDLGGERWWGVIVATYSAMQFFFAPFWGHMSDRIGRKPVIMLGLAGYALSFVLNGLAQSVAMLFIARTLAGILSSATLPTTMAVVADITRPEERARRMGLLGAAMGLGMIFGPGIGGFLRAASNLHFPFFFAAGLALINLAFVFAMLPETRKEGGPARPHQVLGNFQGALAGHLRPLYLTTFVLTFATAGLETTFAYLLADRLHLATAELQMAEVFVAMGLITVLVQGGLIGPLTRRFGEERVMQAGLLASAGGFAAIIATHSLTGAIVYAGIYGVGTALVRPSVTALISRRATVGQGVAIGSMDSFDSLGRIAGPVLANWSYHAISSAAPYVIGALVNLGAMGYYTLQQLRAAGPQLEN